MQTNCQSVMFMSSRALFHAGAEAWCSHTATSKRIREPLKWSSISLATVSNPVYSEGNAVLVGWKIQFLPDLVGPLWGFLCSSSAYSMYMQKLLLDHNKMETCDGLLPWAVTQHSPNQQRMEAGKEPKALVTYSIPKLGEVVQPEGRNTDLHTST